MDAGLAELGKANVGVNVAWESVGVARKELVALRK